MSLDWIFTKHTFLSNTLQQFREFVLSMINIGSVFENLCLVVVRSEFGPAEKKNQNYWQHSSALIRNFLHKRSFLRKIIEIMVLLDLLLNDRIEVCVIIKMLKGIQDKNSVAYFWLTNFSLLFEADGHSDLQSMGLAWKLAAKNNEKLVNQKNATLHCWRIQKPSAFSYSPSHSAPTFLIYQVDLIFF